MTNSETTGTAREHQQVPAWKNKSFWHITILMISCSVFYYMDVIINLGGWTHVKWDIFYTVHDLHRALFLIPAMYAAYEFRLRGIAVTSFLSLLIFLPRALVVSPYPDPLLRALIFMVSMVIIGILLSKLLNNISEQKVLVQDLSQTKNDLLHIKAEEALRESENKYKRLIDNIPDIIFIIDLEGKITFVSKRTKEILGYENEETINMNIFNFIPEEDHQRAIENLQKGMTGEKIRHFQIPMMAKSGEKLIFECSFSRIYKDGVVVGAQGTAADITERKRAEDQLSESLAKLQWTIDEAPVGVAMVGTDKRFLQCNKSFCDFLGYSAEELKGKTIAEITFPDDIEIGMADLRAIVADEKKTSRVQKRYVRKDGRMVWGDLTISLIRDRQGNPLYFLPIIQDITERVQAEEAIRRAEKRSSALIENAPDGIVFVSTDGKFTYASPITYELFGYDTDQMSQLDPNILTHPDDLPKVLTVLSGVIQNPSLVTTLQYRFRHKDGRWLWIESTFSNLIAEPSIQAIVINFRDITERKRSEKALQESERKFRETVVNLDEGYYSVTLAGALLEHNRAFSCILGFDQTADLKGKQMPDFWQNHDDRNVYLQALADKGSISNYEVNARKKTGEKITVIISAHLVKDTNNLPQKIEGIVLDITGRKRLEDKLQESEASLRAVIDSTPFPMALVDVQDNNIEYWSRSAHDLFGHTAPTTPEWYELAYPDPEYRREVIERWKPFLETARRSGQPVNTGEYRVSCHDGSVRICELYATFQTGKLIVTFNDINERKQAEEALLIREKDLKESQRIAHVGSWSLNVATNRVVWSEGLYKMYGFDPALPPPPYTEHMKLFTPESWERLSTALAHTRETGIPYTLELETVRKDGRNGWMWVHGEAEIDSAGKTVGLWGVAQDITERKQAAEEIRNLNKNLEQKVKERTASLNETIDLLEETNRVFVGRELRMIELKERIAELEKK